MKILRLITYLCAVSCALLAQTPCLTVTGDQILGSDLARAVPALAAIPRNTPLAPSPLPGGSRIFSLSELQSLAARFSVATTLPSEVCFRFATEALNRDRAEEAMRKALSPDALIEILETNSGSVPVGTLEFTRNNLGIPATSDQRSGEMWRGDVAYAVNRRFPVWVRVRISVPINRWIAVEALRPGIPIRPGQVRSELAEGFPGTTGSEVLSADQISGMLPLRSVSAGAELRADNLTRPNEVNRGDLVHVEVRVGAAHLALTGRAESAGHVGDMVAVRNPDTSKLFQALVEGTGKVLVAAPGSENLQSQRN